MLINSRKVISTLPKILTVPSEWLGLSRAPRICLTRPGLAKQMFDSLPGDVGDGIQDKSIEEVGRW